MGQFTPGNGPDGSGVVALGERLVHRFRLGLLS